MTHLPPPEARWTPHDEKEDEPLGGVTRRGVLAGAAAATAAVSIGGTDSPATAQTADDMVTFVQLSAALTGIAAGKLATPNFDAKAPTPPNSDPVDIKRVYFDRASKTRPRPAASTTSRSSSSRPTPTPSTARTPTVCQGSPTCSARSTAVRASSGSTATSRTSNTPP